MPHYQPFDSVSCKFIALAGQHVYLIFYSQLDHYGLPGGRVDEGETLAQALQREAREELGVGIKDERLFDSYIAYNDPRREGQTCLVLFYAATLRGEPRHGFSPDGEKVVKVAVADIDDYSLRPEYKQAILQAYHSQ